MHPAPLFDACAAPAPPGLPTRAPGSRPEGPANRARAAGAFVLCSAAVPSALPDGTGDDDWHLAVAMSPVPGPGAAAPVGILRRAGVTRRGTERFAGSAWLHLVVKAATFERRWPRACSLEASAARLPADALSLMGCSGLQALWERQAAFDDAALVAGIEAALDLIERALLARRLGRARQGTLFEQALRTIQRELEDPVLSPDVIAHRLGCSLRSLQTSFARHDTTVTIELRQQRLARAQQTLVDEPHEPIGRLALRCGFNDASHFCRLFKTTFGLSPRQYRRLGREGGGAHRTLS